MGGGFMRRPLHLPFVLLLGAVNLLASCAEEGQKPRPNMPLRPTHLPVLPPSMVVWPAPPPTATVSATVEPGTPPAPEPIAPPSPPPRLARGNDSNADKALAEGDKAFAAADYAAAEKAYSKAAKLAPKDPAPIVGVSRARLGKAGVAEGLATAPDDKTAAAVAKDLKKALLLDPTYGTIFIEHARVLLILGLAVDALVPAKKGAELSPNDAEAHSALGMASLATGDVETAVGSFRKSVALAPGDLGRYLNLGTALLSAAKPTDAQAAFEKALHIAPDNAQAENGLGTAILWQGDPEKAQPHIEKAVNLDPENGSYKQNLGYSWALRGDSAKAIEQYKKAIEKNPKLVSAWINLGNVYGAQDKFKEACEAYAKVHAIDPTDPRLINALIEVDEIAKKKGLAGAGCTVTAK